MADVQDKPVTRISLQQAVAAAQACFHQAYSTHQVSNALLEEVEETRDGKYWIITLGFDMKRKILVKPSHIQVLPDFLQQHDEVKRVYKTFKVDAESGKVLSMKIRPLE